MATRKKRKEIYSLEGREVSLTATGADTLATTLRVSHIPEGGGSSRTHLQPTTGRSLNCPTSRPSLTGVLCLDC